MSEFHYPRECRLSEKSDIQHVFNAGKKLRLREVTLFFVENPLNHPRFCPSVSKKQIAKAHDRNLIKRIFRESFRMHKHQLPACDIVVVGNRFLQVLDKKQLREMIDKALDKLCPQLPPL